MDVQESINVMQCWSFMWVRRCYGAAQCWLVRCPLHCKVLQVPSKAVYTVNVTSGNREVAVAFKASTYQARSLVVLGLLMFVSRPNLRLGRQTPAAFLCGQFHMLNQQQSHLWHLLSVSNAVSCLAAHNITFYDVINCYH